MKKIYYMFCSMKQINKRFKEVVEQYNYFSQKSNRYLFELKAEFEKSPTEKSYQKIISISAELLISLKKSEKMLDEQILLASILEKKVKYQLKL